MGRIKIENKKRNLSLNIELELFEKFEQFDIKNKSKFFNWLLKGYFVEIEGEYKNGK